MRENLSFGLPREDRDLLAAIHAGAFDEVLAQRPQLRQAQPA